MPAKKIWVFRHFSSARYTIVLKLNHRNLLSTSAWKRCLFRARFVIKKGVFYIIKCLKLSKRSKHKPTVNLKGTRNSPYFHKNDFWFSGGHFFLALVEDIQTAAVLRIRFCLIKSHMRGPICISLVRKEVVWCSSFLSQNSV